MAIVVGGYNSSNTSHIVELCEKLLPTYFISGKDEIISESCIQHYNFHEHRLIQTNGYLGTGNPLKIILTSGASCPDSVVDAVLQRFLSFFPESKTVQEVMHKLEA